MNPITKVDLNILEFIQDNLKCEFLDKMLSLITKIGDHGIVPIVIAVILLIFNKTRKIGLSMGIAFICGGLIGNLFLKNVVGRIRPYDLTGADILIERLSDYSFPSGHTLIVFETAVVLLIMLKGKYKSIAIGATIIAIAVAFSRLYLYVHYPTDVLAGIFLGTIFGIVGTKLGGLVVSKFDNKRIKDDQR